MLAVSLGLTWGATRMFGVPFAQGARLEVIKAINGIMMTEVCSDRSIPLMQDRFVIDSRATTGTQERESRAS